MMSSLRYDLGKCAGVSRIEASGMTETARADADRASRCTGGNVIDDVVGTVRIAADAADEFEVIQTEVVAHPPGDHVIGTGSIAAHTKPSNHLLCRAGLHVEPETSAEYVDAADSLAGHGVSRLTIVHGVGGGAVGGCRIDRIAVLEAIEASAEGLDGGEEICGGQRQPVQAEGVGRVGLLRGADTATWPLGTPIG